MEGDNALEGGRVRFYWCHTDGCPDQGRARRRRPSESNCEYCGAGRKLAAPEEDE